MDKNLSLFENLSLYAEKKCREYSITLCSSLIFGFMAHMYAFTNKLVNADEISALFGKGATVTSGRWGLEMTSWLLPDYSMPWIFGLVSVVLLAVSVCMIVSLFQIQSPLLCICLSGSIMAFPALVGNFSFMFTSASYAMAILAAVASVWLFERGGKLRALFSVHIPGCAPRNIPCCRRKRPGGLLLGRPEAHIWSGSSLLPVRRRSLRQTRQR